MVAAGLTLIIGVLALLLQVKVLAPLAVKVEDPPAQIKLSLTVTFMVGLGLMITTALAPDTQLKLLVAATEYKVGPVGFTLMTAVVKLPGVHVYVNPPLAVMVTALPAQTLEAVLTMETVGIGLVSRLSVAVPEHVPSDAVTV